ncbi:hypothetical protein [Maribacter sp. ACAM166]|uniref:hypothetical protein n=1 Tax=Maribacter sp. ACAM166 TaxID=2508996 RepID=UPI0010FF15E0|nr:hypothetical protein [Maribacter sp. ACAM166]TLP75698.1 hypothetical protein ES765_14755 [Maribacter sp. ACAM166]
MDSKKELDVLQEIENATKYQIKEVELEDVVLRTFDELEEYILKNKLEGREMDNLIQDATGAFTDSSIGVIETLKKVKEFMEQWQIKDGLEIPLFID